MEMGTGKTRTTLELIAYRLARGKIKHVLWLCPCSVKDDLRAEIAKHADGALTHIAIYGIESLSSSLRLYELLQRYCNNGPTMLVVDESNLIKNFKAVRTQRIISLGETCMYRVILNGTPISRNEADLFAQWYLLDWRIFGYRSYYSFAANHLEYDDYGKIRRCLNTSYLTEKIAPYTYQVSKDECLKLPDKNYHRVHTYLTDRQEAHYDYAVSRMLELIDDREPATVYRMFSVAQAVISGMYVDGFNTSITTKTMFKDPLDNPRIQTLLDILPDEKTIIFCKYTHEIKEICKILPDAVPFYGGLNQKQRLENLKKFRKNAQYLVANKVCAGYGLNLQHCHNIIYYSNDWNWATRAQSEDRVHRLGQTQDVEIWDICANYTLDVKILRCLDRKESLNDEIKHEIKNANGVKDAKDNFRKWLKGELQDEKNISSEKCA